MDKLGVNMSRFSDLDVFITSNNNTELSRDHIIREVGDAAFAYLIKFGTLIPKENNMYLIKKNY